MKIRHAAKPGAGFKPAPAEIKASPIYQYLPRLKTAHRDAAEVEKVLKEKYGFQTEVLLDASRAAIVGRINEFRKRLKERDSLLTYYAGHGEFDKTADKAYWLPVDAQRDDPTNWIIADERQYQDLGPRGRRFCLSQGRGGTG